MKIRTLLLALTLVAVPSAAQAQICASSPCERVMNITGSIASNVTASVVSGIGFGAITSGTQIATGQFQVVTNQPVGVGVVVTDLTNSNDATVITVTPACRVGASFALGAAFFNGPCASESLSAGTSNIWVRGSITAGTAATAGNYTGTATLTVTYASF
jgi:hypothetical protein